MELHRKCGPDTNGQFETKLPASGERTYNLVAHDGTYNQWRTWANDVRPPLRTEPGEVGAGREVRSSAADLLENRYYDPTEITGADGTFELRFVRGGEQFIQVAPFWLDPRLAPPGTTQTLVLKPGETKGDNNFQLKE